MEEDFVSDCDKFLGSEVYIFIIRKFAKAEMTS